MSEPITLAKAKSMKMHELQELGKPHDITDNNKKELIEKLQEAGVIAQAEQKEEGKQEVAESTPADDVPAAARAVRERTADNGQDGRFYRFTAREAFHVYGHGNLHAGESLTTADNKLFLTAKSSGYLDSAQEFVREQGDEKVLKSWSYNESMRGLVRDGESA